MISEETLMFSGFVENTLEYYGNVLFFIILKGHFIPSNLQAFVYGSNVSTQR